VVEGRLHQAPLVTPFLPSAVISLSPATFLKTWLE
jgi:hypothetical protein